MFRAVQRAYTLLFFSTVAIGLTAARPVPPQIILSGTYREPISRLSSEPDTFPVIDPTVAAQLPQSSVRNHRHSDALTWADLKELATPPTSTTPESPRLPGAGPWMPGTMVIQTARLDLYHGKQTFSTDQLIAIAPLIEQLLHDDEARFGTTLDHRVSLGFYRSSMAPERGVRGLAYTDEGRTDLFYQSGESLDRAATVVAHELAHHLQGQRYGDAVQRHADTLMLEGMATWIVGDRWLALSGATSWKGRARQLQNAGIPLRLLTAERFGANNAYEMWASFVDFLIERYGWEQIDTLYRSGRGRAPGSSNYQAVLGVPLEELADAWRAWVAS